MSDLHSQLGRYVAKPDTTDAEILAMSARAWRDRGVLVILPDQLTNNIDQSMRDTLGKRLYGKRE